MSQRQSFTEFVKCLTKIETFVNGVWGLSPRGQRSSLYWLRFSVFVKFDLLIKCCLLS